MNPPFRTIRVTACVLLAMGLLALGYVAYMAVDAQAYQIIEQRRLAEARPGVAAAVSAAVPAAPIDGRAIGEIEIWRIGLRTIVAQGDSEVVLRRAVGHLADTALPGEDGNVVLAGHRDTFFRRLRLIRVGDTIMLKTPGGEFEYLVESLAVVPPGDTKVIQPTNHRALTLITCFPFGYIGPAPDRFIVRARDVTAAR